MRKTFIEARNWTDPTNTTAESLPLMRKTFIEARGVDVAATEAVTVSSAYAEDFH